MSIRDRVRGRALPTEPVRFWADTGRWAAAATELEEAAAQVQAARARGRVPAETQQRLDDAEAAVEQLEVREFVVRTLTPDDWDLLVGQHPPPEGADPDAQWDPATFFPALLAETVTLTTDDGPESSTVEDWAAMFTDGEFTTGEKNTLINTAVRLNTSATLVSTAMGKGSGRTPS